MSEVGPGSDAEFARVVSVALMPALVERVRGATGTMAALRADPRIETAAAVESETEELGWLFGVVSFGLGADVLLERRRRAALAPVVALARAALAHEGRGLASCAPPPELALEARASQTLAFGLAAFLWRAGSAAQGELAWEWRAEGASLRVTAHAPADAECARFLARRLPDATLSQVDGRWDWSLPAAWFAMRAPV